MAEPPLTQPSLLVRLKDPRDQEAWRRFVQIYGPVVYGYARKRGLQDADAADLTQEVLHAAGRLDYDPAKGTFRGWLFGVAHHKLHDLLARQRRAGRVSGVGQQVFDRQPAREDEEVWDQEYARRLFAWAAEQVRGHFQETTWSAFWQTAVEGKGGKEVAAALGMTVAAVYLAKSRVMARLKKQLADFQGD